MNKINVSKRDITFFILGILSTILLTWFAQKKNPGTFRKEDGNDK